MEDSKLIYALRSLSAYELNRFKKFVCSPYHNSNINLSKYFSALEKSLRQRKEIPLSQVLWDMVFKEEKYSDSRFRKMNSDLLFLFEDFVILEDLRNKSLIRGNLYIKAIGNRKLDRLTNYAVTKVRKVERSINKATSDIYFQRYIFEQNLFNLTSEADKKANSKNKSAKINLKEISDNLDIFFVIEKLRYQCQVLGWKNMYDLDTKINFTSEIETNIKNGIYQSIPLIELHYLILLTLRHPNNHEHYYKLRDKVNVHLNELEYQDLYYIYDAFFSYCIGKVNRGEHEFYAEAFNLYEEAIEYDLLLERGVLSPTTYRNAVFFALKTNRTAWAEKFIETKNDLLELKHRKNAMNFSLARVNMYRKDYEKVIVYLNELDYEDIWYNLNAKAILIAAYYELDEMVALDNLLSSFRIFVTRKKNVSKEKRKSCLNLIRFTKKLSQLLPSEKVKLEKLKKDILAEKGVVNKQWLLEKIEELL